MFPVFLLLTPSPLYPSPSSLFPSQLEHARVTQTELMRESFRHSREMGELLQRQEELQERLAEEARAREQLALELHRAEGESWLEGRGCRRDWGRSCLSGHNCD